VLKVIASSTMSWLGDLAAQGFISVLSTVHRWVALNMQSSPGETIKPHHTYTVPNLHRRYSYSCFYFILYLKTLSYRYLYLLFNLKVNLFSSILVFIISLRNSSCHTITKIAYFISYYSHFLAFGKIVRSGMSYQIVHLHASECFSANALLTRSPKPLEDAYYRYIVYIYIYFTV